MEGEIIAKDLGVINIETEKALKAGDGYIFITKKNDAIFGMDIF
ncbi:MAG: hypothetical protein R2883_02150 [Caldisericia bacterium]